MSPYIHGFPVPSTTRPFSITTSYDAAAGDGVRIADTRAHAVDPMASAVSQRRMFRILEGTQSSQEGRQEARRRPRVSGSRNAATNKIEYASVAKIAMARDSGIVAER